MNQFAFISLLISALIIVICLIVKGRYWVRARRIGLIRFVKSFFRWYHDYRIYDTTSVSRQLYMKANNRINMVVWLVLCFNLFAYIIHRVLS